MNRRNFLGSVLGLAGAVVLDKLPAIAAPEQVSVSLCPFAIVLQPGQSLQDAINSLPASGGTVQVPAGTHFVGEKIEIPKGAKIVCQGSVAFYACSIKAAAPIILEGESNRVQYCILEAEKDLPYFFEVKRLESTSAFKNVCGYIRDAFQEVFDLV